MKTYPLLQSQVGILMACSRLPGSTVYNLPSAIPFSHAVDAGRLESAVSTVFRKRDVLRLRLMGDWGNPRQCSDMEMQPELKRSRMTESQLNAYLHDGFVRPFLLFSPRPLCRFEIIETEKHVWLLMDFHHIIADGMTIAHALLKHDLAAAYEGKSLEEDSRDGLFSYAECEAARIGGPDYERSKAYYRRLFDGVDFSSLPMTRSGVVGRDVTVSELLPRQQIDDWCQTCHTQSNLLFLAAFTVLLSKWCHSSQVAFVTLSHGRHSRRLRQAYGMFVETVPLAFEIKGDTPVADFVRSFRFPLMDAVRYSAYPYTHFCNDFRQSASVSFAFQGDDIMEQVLLGGERVKGMQIHQGESCNGLNCVVYSRTGEYEVRVDASEACVGMHELKAFAKAMATCVQEMIRHTDDPVSGLETVEEEERKRIVERSMGEVVDDDPQKTFIDLFLEQAARTPQAVAVSDGENHLTYAQLEHESRSLSGWLSKKGVQRGHFVGVRTKPCLGFLTAVIAVMRTAAAYVPVDPSLPPSMAERLNADAGFSLLLDPENLPPSSEFFRATEVPLPDNADLAYMIYTSGSTGLPKGVMIPHRALTNLVRFLVRRWHITAESRISCHASLAFDASVEDLFPVLTVGGRVMMMPEEVRHDLSRIHQFIDCYGVTGGCYTTQLGVMVASQPHPSLEYICLGGERLTVAPCTSCHVYNTYGPTEFCVDATYYELEQDRVYGVIPIGRPLDHLGAFVMDADGRLLPWGIVGELCLSGPQMAVGYWGDAQLTASRFWMSGLPGVKVYHTGDLVRWNREGQLEYIGRLDRQVKINGYRVSTDEVERMVSLLPMVSQVCVMVVSPHGHDQLCAYYTSAGQSDERILSSQLRESCPSYMIPSYWVRLDRMPLLPNGKIDRKSLPSPSVVRAVVSVPENALQRKLCAAFKRVLQVGHVGMDDDFFILGGSSLSVMQLLVELEKEGLSVDYGCVFKNPSPRMLAAFLMSRSKSSCFTADDYDYSSIHHFVHASFQDAVPLSGRIGGNILLTGATGFLGAHVLHQLLSESDDPVVCLVRATDDAGAFHRLQEAFSFYFHESLPGDRVMAVAGDLTDDSCLEPLSGQGFRIVIHCAADVRHFADLGDLQRINTDALRTLARFCASCHARLVHVSTLSIAGLCSPGQSPHRFTERDLYIGQHWADPYSYTKFLAERLLLAKMAEGELDAVVMRVGHLAPRLKDGMFQRNAEENGLAMAMRLCAHLGMIPKSLGGLSVEVSPVDVVARALVRIGLSAKVPAICHLASPHSHPLTDLLPVGASCEIVDDALFVDAVENAKADKTLVKMILPAVAYLSVAVSGEHPNPFDSSLTADWLSRLDDSTLAKERDDVGKYPCSTHDM